MRFSEKIEDILKGGAGSGQKGHKTAGKELPGSVLSEDMVNLLNKYEYMEKLNEKQLEYFRKEIVRKVKSSKDFYLRTAKGFKEMHSSELSASHYGIAEKLEKLETKLESSFSMGETKIAIDQAFHLAHTKGEFAVFHDSSDEKIKEKLDEIHDQRLHKAAAYWRKMP